MGGLGQEKRCPKKRGPWTRVWGMGRCCELGAETGTRLPRPPRRPQPRGPDGSPSVNPPRPWGQTSGVHTGQRSRVPGSPPRLCRPGCRLSLADVGGLLGGPCAFAGESHKTSDPRPGNLVHKRPSSAPYAERCPRGLLPPAPGAPRPCTMGAPPARPPSTWRHRGPVAAPWPRSAWPGHCPPRQAHSVPLERPEGRGLVPSPRRSPFRAHPAPGALAPLAVPAPRPPPAP